MKYRNIILILSISSVLSAYGQQHTDTYFSPNPSMGSYGHNIEEKSFVVFPETRDNPIKWYDSLKTDYLKKAYTSDPFILNAQPGEYFVYQVGVKALNDTIRDLNVLFTDLMGIRGNVIATSRMTCFNKGGINSFGKKFSKLITVPPGRTQALWMGIDLEGIPAGSYRGEVTIIADGKSQIILLQIDVKGDIVLNHGFDEGRRLSRMAWLNTTSGLDDSPTQRFEEINHTGNKIEILGRTVHLAPSGLPSEIFSFFESSNQFLLNESTPIINAPFRFVVENENGKTIKLKPGKLIFTDQSPSHLSWEVKNSSNECDLICSGRMEYDGFVDYRLSLKSKTKLKVRDIRLEIPINKEKSKYMMGLNHEGGLRAPEWNWNWDISKNQDMLWIGDVNGGLRIKWKGENYIRPLINIYYAFGPLNLPPSWGNNKKGGVHVYEESDDVCIKAFSGERELIVGEIQHYNFEILITPFKTINKTIKYNDRYFHGGGRKPTSEKVGMAVKAGANILNIHHAEDIYPFINYPYLDENIEELKQLVRQTHEQGLKLKLYYTTRELTKNLPEFYAINSLNGEIIFPGPGNDSRTLIQKNGPHDWLVQNVRENYIPAWSNRIPTGKFKDEIDLSVITSPDSRLNNFYIGGLNWMVNNLEIDGVYIDDSALDRITLRRARKIIDRSRPEGRMDLHSWNHFNKWAGFTNCLNLYMDLLPYFDLVWIGEGRDYDRLPDHWLVEVSGIPFGIPGQMLEGGGNPWRGMVYGITNRAGWGGDPTEIWNFWDEYRIEDKYMIGYWDQSSPIKSNNEMVKTTLYYGSHECIIAIANWSKEDQQCSLNVNWEKLEIDQSNSKFIIPAISNFQEEQILSSLNDLTIPGEKGYLIVIEEF